MFHRINGNRLVMATAGVLSCGTLALLDTASADAQNLATCQFQTHLSLSAGAFSSDGFGSAGCTGLTAGGLAASGGAFEVSGSYTGNPCSMSSWAGTFDAQVPRALALIDPQVIEQSGSVRVMDAAGVLVVAGSGSIEGESVSYTGVGSFTPDRGCGSGELTVQLVVVDSGAPVASQPVTLGASSSQPAAHHKRHKRHARRYGRHSSTVHR